MFVSRSFGLDCLANGRGACFVGQSGVVANIHECTYLSKYPSIRPSVLSEDVAGRLVACLARPSAVLVWYGPVLQGGKLGPKNLCHVVSMIYFLLVGCCIVCAFHLGLFHGAGNGSHLMNSSFMFWER